MALAEAVAAAQLANINPPPQLCLKDSPKEEWTMFKRLFNNYAVITRLNRQEKPYQLAVLLNVMGPTGVRLYDNLTFTEQDDKENTTLIIRRSTRQKKRPARLADYVQKLLYCENIDRKLDCARMIEHLTIISV